MGRRCGDPGERSARNACPDLELSGWSSLGCIVWGCLLSAKTLRKRRATGDLLSSHDGRRVGGMDAHRADKTRRLTDSVSWQKFQPMVRTCDSSCNGSLAILAEQDQRDRDLARRLHDRD